MTENFSIEGDPNGSLIGNVAERVAEFIGAIDATLAGATHAHERIEEAVRILDTVLPGTNDPNALAGWEAARRTQQEVALHIAATARVKESAMEWLTQNMG
jgi:hypothetical protein